MALLTTVWATDENVLTRAAMDFPLLVPPVQKHASGTDGVFGSGNLWLLTSATVDFNAYGIKAGQIVHLTVPKTTYQAPGQCWVIESVSASGITIRRPSQAASIGAPPSPSGGLTGITFAVLTVFPQIENTSYSINRTFGVDATVSYRDPTSIIDVRQLQEVTVLQTLGELYLQASRQPDDDFATKSRSYLSMAKNVLASINLLWDSTNTLANQTGRFNTRLTR